MIWVKGVDDQVACLARRANLQVQFVSEPPINPGAIAEAQKRLDDYLWSMELYE